RSGEVLGGGTDVPVDDAQGADAGEALGHAGALELGLDFGGKGAVDKDGQRGEVVGAADEADDIREPEVGAGAADEQSLRGGDSKAVEAVDEPARDLHGEAG